MVISGFSIWDFLKFVKVFPAPLCGTTDLLAHAKSHAALASIQVAIHVGALALYL